MANSSSKSKTQTRKPASGNGRSAGSSAASKKKNTKTTAKQRREQELERLIRSRELRATLIFVIGLLLLIVAVFAGEAPSAWNTVHTFYFAVFGLTGCILPPAILFLGVLSVLNKDVRKPMVKVLEVTVFFALICGILHVGFVNAAENAGSFGENIKTVYTGIMNDSLGATATGGVLGALIGGLVYALGHSALLAYIILALLLTADLMFLFGVTLFHVFTRMEEPAKKVGEYTEQKIETVKEDYRERRREAAEIRAKKKESGAAEATRVVNDFYDSNDIPREEERRTAGKKTNVDSVSEETGAETFSVFEILQKKNPAEVQTASADSGANPAEIFNLFGEPVNESSSGETKPEKLDPLSEEEAAALNDELSGALAQEEKVYVKPDLDLLDAPKNENKNYDMNELQANGEKLIEALASFRVSAAISDVVPGPTVTRYELSPAKGVQIKKFTGLSDDLALYMAAPAGLRIEAPIPNKSAIGIEIPNRNRASISFREIIDNDSFRNAKSKLNTALGKDISGDVVFADIAKMPHLLVAGTTGSGKSVCMNTMIVSLLYNATPEEVRILLVDPKQVEFGMYNGIPHLLVPVVSDARKASGALGWAVTEMLNRYKTLNANSVRDLASYNSLCEGNPELQKMPQIVIFIDELADLMTVAPAEVEDSIQRIAQMGRAAGMHLVLATQRPSVDVITGVIKANIPSRIALTVKSQIDSRTMIDQAGAEKLMGNGDMLYYPVGVPKPIRVQGAYLKTAEIERIVEFLKSNGTAVYDDVVQQEIERQAAAEKKKGGAVIEEGSAGGNKEDDLVSRAIELFVSAPEKASISALQRHLSLGFAKAGRLMDTLEEKGIVGPTEGSKPRKVLITKAQWYEMNAMSGEVTGNADPTDFDDITDAMTNHHS